METSQLICIANQLTGFYKMEALVTKGLRCKEKWVRISYNLYFRVLIPICVKVFCLIEVSSKLLQGKKQYSYFSLYVVLLVRVN